MEISQLAESFVKRYLENMLYHPAIHRLKQAQELGYYTAILSSSPFFLVEIIAKRFSVNEWIATNYAQNASSRFHSIAQIIEGKEKAAFVHKLASRLDIPLEHITAYSDSRHDLPFLEVVGEKVGVNPDRVLRQACLKNNWEII